MMIRQVAVLSLVFFVLSNLSGQEPVAPVPVRKVVAPRDAAKLIPLRPAMAIRRPSSVVDVSALVRAKLSGGEEPKLILMLETYRESKGDKAVTRVRQEKRTRTVVKDGEPVEQSYIVSVPFVEMVKGADILVPAGIKPQTFDADDFDFYDLAGGAVNMDEARKRLAKLTPVFLMDNFNHVVKGLPEIQQQAMIDNCLIVTSSKAIRKSRRGNIPSR